MIRLNAIFRDNGLEVGDILLVRHQDRRMKAGWTPYRLWRDQPDIFLSYQGAQQAGRFRNGRILSAFVVDPLGCDLFAGLYEIGAERAPKPAGEWIPYFEEPTAGEGDVEYELVPIAAMQDLAGRLVIEWGAGTRAWVQRASNQDKQVIELRPKDHEVEWPGFGNLFLKDTDILHLAANWRAILASTNGVYLLTCPQTGAQYVGSATGQDGFLGRWVAYANGGDGGNVGLRAHRRQTSSTLQITVLEVFGSELSAADALEIETRWKRKLGTRAHSLNEN